MKADEQKRVLIVGAGIAGLAAAVALRRKEVRVDVVEIDPSWSVYGVGILQQANVVRAMAQLGLMDDYLRSGFGFDYVRVHDAAGVQLAKIPARRLAGADYPAIMGISRPALHRVLGSAAQRLGARIRLGVTIERLESSEDRVRAHCSDGEVVEYDLVVGADGLYSKVRGMVFGTELEPRFMGQGVWRYNFPRTPEVDCLVSMVGHNANAGLCPVSDSTMYLYVTSAEPGNPHLPEDRLHLLMRERAANCGGFVRELLEHITDPKQVVYRPLEVVLVPAPWHRGRVVLIGDAAHATTPHLGQGGGMAVEDAVVLAEEFTRDIPLPEVLENFMRRRWERCRFIWGASVQVCEAEVAGRTDIDRPALVEKMFAITSQPI